MKNLKKRVLLGMGLGTIFGLICFAGFATNGSASALPITEWSWSNPMMWMIIINRLTIGFVIAIAGFVTIHPMFKFRMHPVIRGLKIGLLISLPMALGALLSGSADAWSGFWYTLIAGGIIGVIIDLVITKFAGEGKDLS